MPQDLINPAFVDVGDPGPVAAGYLGPGEDWPTFGSAWPADVPVLEPREWKGAVDQLRSELGTDRPAKMHLYAYNDQSPESSCVLNAEECMFRNRRNRILGRAFEIKTAPMWSYQFICSGRHSGSYTMDALKFGLEIGHCPEFKSARSESAGLTLCHQRSLALAPHHYHQNTPYVRRKDAPEFKATARWLRLLMPIHIENRNQFVSALIYGWGVVNGRRGHSIYHGDAVQLRGGDSSNPRNWGSAYLDSYDTDRGEDGWLFDSYDQLNTSGAWACRSIWLPDNPCVFPFGSDTVEIELERYYELFPAVDRDYLRELVARGPGGAVPMAGAAFGLGV